MNRIALASGIVILSTLCLSAQEVPRFTFNVGAGFTQPVGNTSRHLDGGWNIDTGAGINLNPRLGIMAQFNYNSLGINSDTLANIGFPNGTVRMWSVTLDPVVHLSPGGPVDVYLLGGGGLYHRVQEFTQPGVAGVVAYDPFFEFFPAAVPVEQVVASYSVNKPGVNGGMGVSFGTKGNAKFYAEARYHRMILGNYTHTDMVPVTFGFRW